MRPVSWTLKSFGRYQYTRGKLSSKIANKVQSEQIFNLLKINQNRSFGSERSSVTLFVTSLSFFMTLVGHTHLRIDVSLANFDAGADFQVRLPLVPQFLSKMFSGELV